MYEFELETSIALARTAGKAVLQHYAGDVEAESKIGADSLEEPVTVADRDASRIIVEGLLGQFPNDGILSEEEHDRVGHRLARERVWIIDPIDGTAGFLKKDGDFAVQIGLAVNGKAVAGVVFLPESDVLYYASAGGGTYRSLGGAEAHVLRASDRTDFRSMFLAVSRDHRSPRISRIMQGFGFGAEVQRGSVGLKVGLIAQQECDVYIHLSPRTKLWDTCAPQIILEEAGGKVTDLWGEAFRYDLEDVQNWGGIVATNGVIHDQIVSRLQPLLTEFGRHKIRSRAAD